MDMRLFGVVTLLVCLAVVVAVRQFAVVVGVRVPVGPVLDAAIVLDVMGDMSVVVAVGHRRVGVLRCRALTLNALVLSHHFCSFPTI
jgi:hypothetical protein